MKNILLIALIMIATSCSNPQAELINDGSLLTLDSYTIPQGVKGAKITKIIGLNGIPTLKSLTDDIFEITNDGYITLKKDEAIDVTSPIKYDIELIYKGGSKKFTLVKDDFIKNGIIAHRGAWKHHEVSQNSIGSLKAAIGLGCEAVEFDVWFSKDNKIILSHDPEIGGFIIEDTTADELCGVALKNEEFVPTLEQYLEQVKTQNRTRLVLEIKVSLKGLERNLELTRAAVEAVHSAQAQAWVDYISFSFENTALVAQLDKSAHTAYLETNKTLEEIVAANISGIDYHFSSFENNPNIIKECNELGLTTNFWTVNNQDMIEELFEAGSRFITTDEPEIALEVIRNKG